jgi:hypothetical protein
VWCFLNEGVSIPEMLAFCSQLLHDKERHSDHFPTDMDATGPTAHIAEPLIAQFCKSEIGTSAKLDHQTPRKSCLDQSTVQQ